MNTRKIKSYNRGHGYIITFVATLAVLLIMLTFFSTRYAKAPTPPINGPVALEISRLERFVGEWEVTAYTPGRIEETDGDPCIGAWGDDVCFLNERIQVFASAVFPRGTELNVGGIYGFVFDRPAAKNSHIIDIAMPTQAEGIEFGRQFLPVYEVIRYATSTN